MRLASFNITCTHLNSILLSIHMTMKMDRQKQIDVCRVDIMSIRDCFYIVYMLSFYHRKILKLKLKLKLSHSHRVKKSLNSILSISVGAIRSVGDFPKQTNKEKEKKEYFLSLIYCLVFCYCGVVVFRVFSYSIAHHHHQHHQPIFVFGICASSGFLRAIF